MLWYFISLQFAYNNVFRALFNLDRSCSVSQEMTKRNIDTFAVVLRKLIYNISNIWRAPHDIFLKKCLFVLEEANIGWISNNWALLRNLFFEKGAPFLLASWAFPSSSQLVRKKRNTSINHEIWMSYTRS